MTFYSTFSRLLTKHMKVYDHFRRFKIAEMRETVLHIIDYQTTGKKTDNFSPSHPSDYCADRSDLRWASFDRVGVVNHIDQ